MPLWHCLAGVKEEVAAHLANFAYDPINYEHMRQVSSGQQKKIVIPR